MHFCCGFRRQFRHLIGLAWTQLPQRLDDCPLPVEPSSTLFSVLQSTVLSVKHCRNASFRKFAEHLGKLAGMIL